MHVLGGDGGQKYHGAGGKSFAQNKGAIVRPGLLFRLITDRDFHFLCKHKFSNTVRNCWFFKI